MESPECEAMATYFFDALSLSPTQNIYRTGISMLLNQTPLTPSNAQFLKFSARMNTPNPSFS